MNITHNICNNLIINKMARIRNKQETSDNWKSVLYKLKDSILRNEYKSLRLHFVDNAVASSWSMFLRERGYFNDIDLSYFLNIKIDDSLIAEYRDWEKNREQEKRITKKQQDDKNKIEPQENNLSELEKTMIKEMIDMLVKLRDLMMNFDDKQMSKSAYIELSKMTYEFYKKLDNKLNTVN